MLSMRKSLAAAGALAISMGLMACGGGGGGSISGGASGSVLYYPYSTVYGDVCTTSEATPGCTFDAVTGQRITVAADPSYDQYNGGSNDLWYVQFDSAGGAEVFNSLGQFQYRADVSQFAGYVGATTIGVGTTGLFWEDIRNGTYWLGKNGVLYSANQLEGNYGKAINDHTAGDATDTNFSAINSDGNKKLVKRAAEKLVKDYGFKLQKATAVASALNAYAVAGVERGVTTTKDIDKTFKAVFGVQYGDALTAVKDLASGDKTSMQNLTNRSAAALGLKPNQAQKFMKGMYKKALSEWGYDADSISW
jgi:hypothetical protein